MPSITARLQGLSLDEPAQAATAPQPQPQPENAPPQAPPRRGYYRRTTNPTQVNVRPLPPIEEVRAYKKRCIYYGFYAGDLTLEKMIIRCFPEELAGRDPRDPHLFLAAVEFIRDVTDRPDICIPIAIIAQRNKDADPSIEGEVGEATFIVGLLQLDMESYINRITQENVDMLAEFLGAKPSWWEIEEFTEL